MQKTVLWRVAMIIALTLLMLIPLTLIRSVVSDRQMLQRHVEETIAGSLAGPQRIAGPVLVVPYWEREYLTKTDERGHEQRQAIDRPRQAIFVAEKLSYTGDVQVSPKYKGLYKALVYESVGGWQGEFAVPPNLGLESDASRITLGKRYVSLGISDVRGLRDSPQITCIALALVSASGSRLDAIGEGVHAMLPPLELEKSRTFKLTMTLKVAGTSGIAFVPLGKFTSVKLASRWPHPNFGGRFLPVARQIDASGFTATWETSHLASRNGALLKGAASPERNAIVFEAFDVTFIEPVSIYLQAERAVKYGVLFIAITFAAFFLFETLKELRIHPLQYAMVGLALSTFFLLLVSLSEHVAFAIAYGIAASACVLLISYYLSYVLGGWRRGAVFGAKLLVLYGVLFGLLLSEDNALMLGSLLLFAVLAAVMILTRRVNWYRAPANVGAAPATS